MSLPAAATCATCGTELQGPYCHACGERTLEPDEFRLRRFAARTVEATFDLDSRLTRSFRALLARPGLLTAEYMAGRRRRWLGPLQVFLVANVVFFGALSLVGGFNTFTTQLRYHVTQWGYGDIARDLALRQGAEGSEELRAFAARFNEATPRYANALVIIMVPLFAGILALLHAGKRRPYVQHLVFSLHFFAFMLLVMTLMPLALRAVVAAQPELLMPVFDDEGVLTVLVILVFGLYLSRATRRGYGDGHARATLIGFAATLLLLPIITIYRAILFFVVYYSLR